MATKLDPVIFGKDKSINYSKISVGALAQAVSEDLVEFDEHGVQGVKLGGNLDNFLKYEKAAKRAKDPYFQMGVHSNGSLVLVLLDKKDTKFEAIEIAVKGYEALKNKLAASTAKVVNVSEDKDEPIIKKNSAAQADKFKTTLSNEDDPDFGSITGNVVLCAHGRPAALPSGRLIGDRLGPHTPEQIVKLLTGSKDADKRIGMSYNGIVTLSGCFTASGGPEAEEQDDPFAAKVLALFRKAGYSRLSVVGMPGRAQTATEDVTDSHGIAMKRGDKSVKPFAATAKKEELLDRLQTELNELVDPVKDQLEILNAAIDKRNAATKAHKAFVQQFTDAKKDTKLEPGAFLADPATIALGKKIATAKATFEDLDSKQQAAQVEFDKRRAAYDAKDKELEDTGLAKRMARFTGNFGLRQLN